MKPPRIALSLIIMSVGLNGCASNSQSSLRDMPRGAPIAEQLFDRLDADGDNIVTFAEIEADRIAVFERLDENGDGFIDTSEMNALRNRGLPQTEIVRPGRNGRVRSDRLFRMDRNRDGRISLNEFDGLQGSLLDRADFNGDGDIDRAEFDDMRARQRSRSGR